MAGQNRPLPELVRDWRLQATIQQNGNVTTHTRPPSTRETWTREKRLGRGGYGDVWLERKVKLKGARGSHTADLRAVKCLEISNRASHSDAEHFYVREIEALAKFSQANMEYNEYFVKFFGWYKAPGSLYIAMEYCEHGDLRMYLADHKTLPEDQVQVVVRQVLGALSSMHKEGFAHRDLKPANILIKTHPPEHEWWTKVCDLGLSKRAEGVAGGLTTTMRGTENFMAPETKGFPFTGDPRTADPFRADIWSLGETVFRALTGHGTFQDPVAFLDYQQGKHNFPLNPLREAKASPLAQSFVVTLMSPLPKTRPEAPDALRHPWIKQGDEPSLVLPDTETVYQSQLEPGDSSLYAENDLTKPSGQWTTTMPHRGAIPSNASHIPNEVEITLPSGSWSTTSALQQQRQPPSPASGTIPVLDANYQVSEEHSRASAFPLEFTTLNAFDSLWRTNFSAAVRGFPDKFLHEHQDMFIERFKHEQKQKEIQHHYQLQHQLPIHLQSHSQGPPLASTDRYLSSFGPSTYYSATRGLPSQLGRGSALNPSGLPAQMAPRERPQPQYPPISSYYGPSPIPTDYPLYPGSMYGYGQGAYLQYQSLADQQRLPAPAMAAPMMVHSGSTQGYGYNTFGYPMPRQQAPMMMFRGSSQGSNSVYQPTPPLPSQAATAVGAAGVTAMPTPPSNSSAAVPKFGDLVWESEYLSRPPSLGSKPDGTDDVKSKLAPSPAIRRSPSPIILAEPPQPKPKVPDDEQLDPLADLWVFGLDPSVTEAVLFELFCDIGQLRSIRVDRDQITGRSLGSATVRYKNASDAAKAEKKLNGTTIKGRPFNITYGALFAPALFDHVEMTEPIIQRDVSVSGGSTSSPTEQLKEEKEMLQGVRKWRRTRQLRWGQVRSPLQ